MNNLAEIFGRRVKALRQLNGMTLSDLADQTNITARGLSSIERGQASPRFHTIEAIATALNVQARDLFDPS